MDWSHSLVIGFDTETTGLDAWNGRIIQFGVSVWQGHGFFEPPTPVAGGDWCIDCGSDGVPIEPGARKAHGIPDERIAGCDPFDRQIGRLLGFLQPFVRQDHVFTAYNAPFDLAYLVAAFHRCQQVLPIAASRVLDPVTFARKAWVRQGNRLVDVAPRLNVVFSPHDALADAQATVQVLFAIARKWNLAADLDEVLAQQDKVINIWNRDTGHDYRDQLSVVEKQVIVDAAAR